VKIAHILNTPFASHGGLALLAREIALGLSEEYETYVFCPKNTDEAHSVRYESQKVHFIEWEQGATYGQIVLLLMEQFDLLGIDLAIFHGGDFSWGVIGGKCSVINKVNNRGRPVITINHQSNPVFSRLPTGQQQGVLKGCRAFSRFMVAWFYKNIQLTATDIEINVSRYEYEMSRCRYPLFARKFRLVYHSRLPPMGDAMIPREKKEKIILSVGHFAYRKGQHVLLRAFGRIAESFPSWRLQLVGALNVGEYHSVLESILNDLNIRDRVDFVTETHDPDGYFKQASVYVQPSLVEAYGLALQEAMYFGCACVGSAAGGITDSISDPKYLFPPGDDEKLADILRQLLSNQDLLADKMELDLLETRRLKRDRESMLFEYKRLIDSLVLRQRRKK
jgi:glycosyltransferase involved in cell wall biosynthesis